ncbi:MAG: tetratricopeptide repeat protein [Candidatus Riflebacteria bacterium]|nr:tetratricopeptide repeat protein [Candidatus Riflebacteria bacterium]
MPAAEDYSTLRKFLTAKMYGEAYNEILRLELSRDEFDPKLEKLRTDLLDPTRERLNKQARVNPDDAAIFTILADIAFHKGKFDEATTLISKALNNKSGPMANYVFAKILFRKGNLPQAFDQIGTVLESMPDSPVVFEDFQFLYACKSYGIATARKISRNTNFLKRATPVDAGPDTQEIPESPFENDPTQIATVPKDPAGDKPVDPAPISGANVTDDIPDDDSPLPDATPPGDEPSDLPDEDPDFIDDVIDDNPDEPADTGAPTVVVEPRPTPEPPATAVTATVEVDPEEENIKKAEYWLNQAARQFENRNYDDADNNWKTAVELHPELPGKDDLRAKIDAKFDLFKRYKKAKDLFDLEKYEQALPDIEDAYKQEPDRFKEAAFLIGKIYLLRPEPDYDQALKYLDIVLAQKDLDPLFKRDIEWTKLEMYYGMGNFEEANNIFTRFMRDEEAFTRNQVNFTHLRIGLWYNLNQTLIIAGFAVFITLFIIVFLLRLLPAITLSLSDPLTAARRMFDAKKYQKAISIAEKALNKKQPVQIEREILEILVKCHFELKNFVRCQENARIILEKFPGNTVAWGFLAKASMASHDTSNEAISMYEAIYKENPAKTEYLPVLAKHYAQTGSTTVEAMNILFTYYQTGTKEPPVITALADAYVLNRTMGNEVITVLEDALKLKDKVDYRELLARNFSKNNRYSDAARECIKVLNENINNMGIHVVYTSSMKKLKKIDEAINQYKDFLQRYPGNPQLTEILSGLKKDATAFSSDEDSLPSIPDELPMPDLPDNGYSPQLGDIDIDNYVEPPPEGFDVDAGYETPLPEFLKNDEYQTDSIPDPVDFSSGTYGQGATSQPANKGPGLPQVELPTLDPFDENTELFDDFSTDLPEELGGMPDVGASASFEDFSKRNQVRPDDLIAPELPRQPRSTIHSETVSNSGLATKLASAEDKARAKKWDEVIELLSSDFASERNQLAGLMLADAWLGKNKALMALEIIETLDFDPEIMSERIKDVLYRTGVALEAEKRPDEKL